MNNTYLQHHGILGQKWGIRRYQNEDGSLTPAGKKRYGTEEIFNKHLEYKKAQEDSQHSYRVMQRKANLVSKITKKGKREYAEAYEQYVNDAHKELQLRKEYKKLLEEGNMKITKDANLSLSALNEQDRIVGEKFVRGAMIMNLILKTAKKK